MSLICKVDYLSGVGNFSTFGEMKAFLDGNAERLEPKDKFIFKNHGGILGERFNIGISSVKKMYGGYRQDDDCIRLILQLPGTFCSAMTNQHEHVQYFCTHLRPTRFDSAMDDYKRRVSQITVNQLGELGHYKGLNSYKMIQRRPSQDIDPIKTCYFGSDTSDKKIRFYDAEFIHGIGADRWELEARREYAEDAAAQFIDNPECLGGMITGAIDFVKRGATWRDEERYSFWESIIREIGEVKLYRKTDEPTLERMISWLHRQVGGSLSILYHGLGENEFNKILKSLALSKFDKLSDTQLNWINYLKENHETENYEALKSLLGRF